jgi:SAM-dependent methyltransferase
MGIERTLWEFKPTFLAANAIAYLLFRLQLPIATLRDRLDSKRPGCDPVPPARLRHRVHGSLNKSSYLQVGTTVAQNVKDLCRIAGRDFDSFTDILDFGSGCGRVIQNLRDRPASSTLYATDIDPDLVDWGKKNLGDIQWSLNNFAPPLPFNDGSFDLIYCISVFTHLDENFQHEWLQELQRIAKQGATLILTVHGEYATRRLDLSYRDEIHKRGFMYIPGPTGKLKLDGLPDFYQTTYHTREYVYNQWSTYFDIVDYVERGINNHQDAVILRGR